MNAALSVHLASIPDTHHNECGRSTLKDDSVVAVAKPPLASCPLHLRDTANAGRSVKDKLLNDSPLCFGVKCSKVALAGFRPDDFFHKPSSRISSAVVNTSPRRTASSASAIAARSSSVVGSSSTGAFARERSTGSSFSARGMRQVCSRPAGLHRQRLLRTDLSRYLICSADPTGGKIANGPKAATPGAETVAGNYMAESSAQVQFEHLTNLAREKLRHAADAPDYWTLVSELGGALTCLSEVPNEVEAIGFKAAAHAVFLIEVANNPVSHEAMNLEGKKREKHQQAVRALLEQSLALMNRLPALTQLPHNQQLTQQRYAALRGFHSAVVDYGSTNPRRCWTQ